MVWWEQPEVVVSLVLSILSFLAWVYTVGFKMGRLETQVGTLWDIYVKDALSEATRLSRSNPINIHALFNENLKETIRKIGDNMKSKHKHNDLIIAIEKNLGNELMKIATEKKVPYRTLLGTALLIAEGTIK